MKILVCGWGSIGKRHLANAGKQAETAVFDLDSRIADKCRQEHGIPAFDDLKAALEWKPDGAVIATPTNLHIPIALASMEAGAHVLIEKPISHSTDGVDAFLSRAQNLKRQVFVVCNMRFHPALRAIRSNLSRIGRPLFARAHYGNYLPEMRPNADYRKLYAARREQGGGAVLDGIHELDYLVWLFGSVKKIAGNAAKLSKLEIETEDYACICLQHESGVASEIHLDYLRPFKRRGCEIVGELGMILWQSEGKQPENCSIRLYEKQTRQWESLLQFENVDLNKPYEKMMEHFIKGIQGHEVPLLEGRQAAEELSVALQALKISQNNPET